MSNGDILTSATMILQPSQAPRALGFSNRVPEFEGAVRFSPDRFKTVFILDS